MQKCTCLTSRLIGLGLLLAMQLFMWPRQAMAEESTAGESATTTAPVRQLTPPASLDDLLARDRWDEQTYGLSLRPPLGSQLVRESADDAMLRIIGDRKAYAISLTVTDTKAPIFFEQVVQQSVVQVANVHPQARILEQAEATVMGRRSSVIYFQIISPKGEKLVLGQALVPVTLTTLAVLRLDVDEARFARSRPIFEALLFSMDARDVQMLDKERRALIDRGTHWKRGLTVDAIRAALVPEQWFRIVEAGRDIGFLYVVQGRGSNMNLPGLRVEVGTRLELAGQRVDSVSRFFMSESGAEEVWSIRTTSRQLGLPRKPTVQNKKKPAQPDETIWSESGVRSDMVVKVTREGPEGPKRMEWVKPSEGYLSQVEVFLLGSLLPGNAAAEYGFYAYHPNQGRLAFRTEKVEPAADGSYVVRSRPTLDQPEQVTRYDAKGRLLERELGEGRKLIPSSKSEVSAIFKLPATPTQPTPTKQPTK